MGYVSWLQRQRVDAADYDRTSLAIGAKATSMERQRRLNSTKVVNGRVQVYQRTIGEEIEHTLANLRNNLDKTENRTVTSSTPKAEMRSDGTYDTPFA